MLLAIGIAPIIQAVSDRAAAADRPVRFPLYHDDVFIEGKPEDCLAAYRDLSLAFSEIGLHFNVEKSTMYTLADVADCPFRVSRDGLIVLGVPVGTDAFVVNELETILQDQTRVLPALENLGASIMFLMLKWCVNTRPVYHMRGAHPDNTGGFATAFDGKVDKSLGRLVQMVDDKLPELSKEVRSLPFSMGGLGMRSMCHIRHVAYYSSWLYSLQYIREHLPHFMNFTRYVTFDKAYLASLHLDNFPQTQSNSFQDVILPMIGENCIVPAQKDLTVKIDKEAEKRIHERYTPVNREAMALLVSAATPGTSSWMFACMHYLNPALRIEDKDFRENLRIRMLLPTHDDNIPRHCRSCNVQNVSGYHAYHCVLSGQSRIQRHNDICRALGQYIKSASEGIHIDYEKVLSDPPLVAGQTCTADIVLRSNHNTKYIDVRVCSPCAKIGLWQNGQPTEAERLTLPVAKASIKNGERAKYAHYSGRYGAGITPRVIPFVLELTGRLGDCADKLVNELAKLYEGDHSVRIPDEKLKSARRFFMMRLGVLLARGNAAMVRNFRNRIETAQV